MPDTYTEQDIRHLVEKSKRKKKEPEKQGNFTSDADIAPFVGKKNDKVVITAGFKLKHKKTGLVYTVQSVDFNNKDVMMNAVSGDGLNITIPSKEFKQYERL